jgi:hypothetical protein
VGEEGINLKCHIIEQREEFALLSKTTIYWVEGGDLVTSLFADAKSSRPRLTIFAFRRKAAQTKITLRLSNPAKHKAVYVWQPYHNF